MYNLARGWCQSKGPISRGFIIVVSKYSEMCEYHIVFLCEDGASSCEMRFYDLIYGSPESSTHCNLIKHVKIEKTN